MRLWPFAPRRTRGNAALSAKISFSTNWGYISKIIDRWFEERFGNLLPDDSNHSAQPVLLAMSEQPAEEMYWQTVRGEVELQSRIIDLKKFPCKVWSSKRGLNGIIGSSAAIAWRGENDYTWESVSYTHLTLPTTPYV